MTVVAGLNSVEAVYLASDSRVSWGDNKVADVGQKIFSLSSHIAVGFSGDVEYSLHIIKCITELLHTKPDYKNIVRFKARAKGIVHHFYSLVDKRFARLPQVSSMFAGIQLGMSRYRDERGCVQRDG